MIRLSAKVKTGRIVVLVSLLALALGWFLVRRDSAGHAKTESRKQMAGEVARPDESRTKAFLERRRPSRVPGEAQAETIPAHLLPLMDVPGCRTFYPPWELLTKLTVEDKALLMREYRNRSNAADRAAIVRALAHLGGDDVVDLFIYSLSLEFSGRELTTTVDGRENEEVALMKLVSALGILSAKNDAAYAFLKQGIDPSFWKVSVQWRSKLGNETYGVLTALSIQALGMSGRQEIRPLLERLRNTDLVNRTGGNEPGARTFYGDVVTAAFYNDLVEKRGVEFFHRKWADGELERYWEGWSHTDNGKAWRAWSAAKRQTPQ